MDESGGPPRLKPLTLVEEVTDKRWPFVHANTQPPMRSYTSIHTSIHGRQPLQSAVAIFRKIIFFRCFYSNPPFSELLTQKKDRPKGRRLNLVLFGSFGGAFVPTFLPLDKLVKANLIWLKYIRYFIFKFGPFSTGFFVKSQPAKDLPTIYWVVLFFMRTPNTCIMDIKYLFPMWFIS